MKISIVRSATRCALATTAAGLFASTATAGPQSCESRVNNTHAKLLECVTFEGVREHQAEFQAIADANGGTRAAGTPGYDASVDYVVARMTAAGYNVTLNGFRSSSSRQRFSNRPRLLPRLLRPARSRARVMAT